MLSTFSLSQSASPGERGGEERCLVADRRQSSEGECEGEWEVARSGGDSDAARSSV